MYINASKSYAIKMTSMRLRGETSLPRDRTSLQSDRLKIEMLEMIEYFYGKIRREGEKKFWFSKKKGLVSKITGTG